MRHLPPDLLIDIAEGTRPESSASHLVECGECRGGIDGWRINDGWHGMSYGNIALAWTSMRTGRVEARY